MRTIWKYQLQLTGWQQIEIPIGAQILSVQNQGGIITLWALVDSENRNKPRTFLIYRTGLEFAADGVKYLGTVQTGALVWHVFEKL